MLGATKKRDRATDANGELSTEAGRSREGIRGAYLGVRVVLGASKKRDQTKDANGEFSTSITDRYTDCDRPL